MSHRSDISVRQTRLSAAKRALLEKRLRGEFAGTSKAQIIPRRLEQGPVSLSFAQQRLWFLDQLEPGNPVYNIPIAVRLTGLLNTEALEQSLSKIVHRHEALRTIFVTLGEQPAQIIAPTLSMAMPVVDLQHLPEAEREIEARRLTIEEARQPFDLARGPLLRATLLQMGEADHVLLLVMHHIVSDGWSLGLLFRELAILYETYTTGTSSPLPELPIQYADFAVWQREWLQGTVLEAQLAYWKEQLSGNLPMLQLPTDRPRPPVQTFHGAFHSFVVPQTLVEALKGLSQQARATLFMTLLAAFKVLLYRYTSQTDILVGTPIANRTRSEIEGLIGFFVNTLVLRNDVSGNPTFLELLDRVREVALEAYDHQDIPFEKLVDVLQPERNLSHTPLFQVMFALHNTPMAPLELAGLTLSPIDVETGTAKFDLTLSLTETEQGLAGILGYNTDLFDSLTIARMEGHFQTLLAGIVAHPEQRLSELPLLTGAERHQLLVEWNDTKTDYPQDQCIHHLFEAQVEQTPDAVAVAFEEERLTYRELNRRANQLAYHLRALGVGPEVLVGIYVERSLEMVVGLLGVLKAGGAYVPLDPTYPQERLTFMLEDSHVPVLLTQASLVAELPDREARVICLDTDWNAISRMGEENPISGIQPDSLAYVIYTTGSTGKPKGVLVEHKQVLNYLHSILERLELMPGASYAMVQPFTVDSCLTVIFSSLCTGGVLHIIPRNCALDPHALGNYFRHHPIDCLKIAPSHLAVLQSSSEAKQFIPRQCLVIGGEASRWDWVEALVSMADECQVFNHYGPTETTVGVLTYRVEREHPAHDYSMTPVGRPIANTQIYLLDSYLQPVPIGVPGELYIGGANIARGYLNRPDLTAENFVPNPYSAEAGSRLPAATSAYRPSVQGSRLYKTGDLARYLPDGNIEFLGRTDHQVKIHGFRIELGEIEAILAEHPAVREAVVVAREDRPGDKRLVAYVAPNQEQAPLIDELRRFLKSELPDYMIPSTFVILEALPLTHHGKVDRRALPTPAASRPELASTYVAPRNSIEELLVNIWVEVLGLEQVGVYDHFFELGGHSLLATQLVFRVRETFQVELPLRNFFEDATVAGLAQLIAASQQLSPEAVATETAVPDFGTEAVLDPTIRPKTLPPQVGSLSVQAGAYITEPTAIFLTGATGFLGAFLLYELLQQTQADVYCLVRAADVEMGKQRIQKQLESYLLWDQDLSSRIIPVVGDLAQPYLGLPAQQFRALASQIDVIYHSGALVNFVYPYYELKPANVLGTQEVLRLAAQTTIPVHHISTLSVFDASDYYSGQLIQEGDELNHAERLPNGYAQSKWVAEKLVTVALARELPVSIYRLGAVVGDSRTGAWNTNDYVCRFIKGCIQLGSIPDQDTAWQLAPVDYVSQAIVHLSRQPASLGKAFHIFSPHRLHQGQLADWIRAFGYELRQLSFDQWQAELLRVAGHSPKHALYPFLPFLMEKKSLTKEEPQFGCQNLLDGLTDTAIVCPPLDAKLLGTYFSYFIRNGFLDAPLPGGELEHLIQN